MPVPISLRTGKGAPIGAALRSRWLPLIIGILGAAASLLFWRAELRDDRRKLTVFGEEQARNTAESLHRGINLLTQALAHLVEQHGAAFRDASGWTIDLTGLNLALWVDPSGEVRQIVPRKGHEV